MPLTRTIALPTAVPILVIGAVCLFALWKGGREERLAAGAFIAALFAPFLRDQRWIGTQWTLFLIDVGYLGLLLFLAMKTSKYWPIFASGFQLLGVVTHAASLIDKKLGAWAYITAGIIWTYLVLFAIGLGAWNHWMLQRQIAEFSERDP